MYRSARRAETKSPPSSERGDGRGATCEPTRRKDQQHRQSEERTTAWIEREDIPMRTGQQTYNNFVRPHIAPGGETQAGVGGIAFKEERNWLALLRKIVERWNSEK